MLTTGARSPDQEAAALGQSRLLPCGGDQSREGKGGEKRERERERRSFKVTRHNKKCTCSLLTTPLPAQGGIPVAPGRAAPGKQRLRNRRTESNALTCSLPHDFVLPAAATTALTSPQSWSKCLPVGN